jgi:two-component system CitB family sensor kinase
LVAAREWDHRAVRPIRGSLARQVLLLQLAVVLVTVGIGAAVTVHAAQQATRDGQRDRALAIATALANEPEVAAALTGLHPERRLQPLAERTRHATGVAFIVVMSPQGIRYSHPDPRQIGRRFVGTFRPAAAGHVVTETRKGTLGRSVRAVVPVRDARGRIVGLVAAGVLVGDISAQVTHQLPRLLTLAAVALLIGTLLSLLLARRVKRQSLGLEPTEIAALYEHHDAVLHAIREGVLVLDREGRLLLANDEAERLASVGGAALGRPLAEALPAGSLRDLVAGDRTAQDELHLLGDRVLVVSRRPALVDGRRVGDVVTLRDRTELRAALAELVTVKGMADSLRAQAHESANRLHTLVGLVELGRYEEAVRFATEEVALAQDLLGRLQEQVGEPALVALLLGKTAAAQERGVVLRIADHADLRPTGLAPIDLVTIVGNLIDNALDAVGTADPGAVVEVDLRHEGDDVVIEVRDNGPGVPDEALERVFEAGFTSKPPSEAGPRGLGLALVSQTARRLGGTVAARNDDGAVFTVRFPLPKEAPVA